MGRRPVLLGLWFARECAALNRRRYPDVHQGYTRTNSALKRRDANQFAPNDELVDRFRPLIGGHAFQIEHVTNVTALDADAAGTKGERIS